MLVSSDSGSEAESLQVCCRCFRLLSVVVGCRRLLSVVVVVVGCCRLSVLVGVQAIEAESMVDDDESAILESDGGWRVVGAGLDPWEKLRRTPEAQADLRARRMEQWVASLGRCGCAVSMCVCVCGTFLGGAFGNALRSCGCWVSRGSPNVALQVLLRGSLSPPCARVCDVFRLALLGLQGASWQKQCAELGVACLYQVRGRCALCPLVWRGGARVCTLALCRR